MLDYNIRGLYNDYRVELLGHRQVAGAVRY